MTFTKLQKTFNPLAIARLVFYEMKAEKPGESAEKQKDKKTENLISFYEKNEAKITKGVNLETTPQSTFEKLAGDKKMGTEMFTRYMESYTKIADALKSEKINSAKELWDYLVKNAKTVSVIKGGDGWYFFFQNEAGNDVLTEMDRTGIPIETPKLVEGVDYSSQPIQEYLIGRKDKKNPKLKDIAPNPKAGDKIILYRYGGEAWAKQEMAKSDEERQKVKKPLEFEYNADKQGFYDGNGQKLKFWEGDVVRYEPKAVEAAPKKDEKAAEPKPEAPEKTYVTRAQERAKEREEKRNKDATVDELTRDTEYQAGLDDLKKNPTLTVDSSMAAILDSARLWNDAWENPGAIKGLPLLKEVIRKEPIFAYIKNEPDRVRNVLRQAMDGNKISFKRIVEVVMGESGLRLPSEATTVEMNKNRLDFHRGRYPSLLNNRNAIEDYKAKNPDWSTALNLATGFATALSAAPGTEVLFYHADSDSDGKYVELIVAFEGHMYTVRVVNGATAKRNHVRIFHYPTPTPYADNDGYDNSENWPGNRLFDSNKSKDILNWFRDAVTPKITYSNFNSNFDKYFEKDGTPKPIIAQRPDLVAYYRNLIIGAEKSMRAVSQLSYDKGSAERYENVLAAQRKETAKTTYGDKMNQYIVDPEGYTFSHYTSLNQVDISKTGDYQKAYRLSKGLLDRLGPGFDATVVRQGEARNEYYVDLLVKTPSHGMINVRVIHNTAIGPNIVEIRELNYKQLYFKESTLVENSGRDNKVKQEFLDTLEGMHLRTRTWADVVSQTARLNGAGDYPHLRTMDAKFANDKLTQIMRRTGALKENGEYDQEKYLNTLRMLAEKGYGQILAIMSSGDESLKTSQQDLQARMAGIESAAGIKRTGKEGMFTEAQFTLADLSNPEKGPVISDLIRRGLVEELANIETQKQADLQKKLDEAYKEFEKDPNGQAQAIAAIKEAYAKAGKKPPENLESTLKEKVFPIMFGLGYDVSSGVLGIGAGISVPIDLGEGGKIYVGGGLGVGFNLKESGKPSVGGGVFAGYETPKWGRFSILVGGGVGANTEGFGVAAGAGLNIDLGGQRFNHKLTVGAAIIPGVPMVIPSVLFSFEANHDNRKEALISDALGAYGFYSVEANPTTEEMAKHPLLARALILKNQDELKKKAPKEELEKKSTKELLDMIGQDKLKTDIEELRRSIVLEVNRKYDPAKASPGATFGLGYDVRTGRFIFGAVLNYIDFSSKESVVKQTKAKEDMDNEAATEQYYNILKQARAGELSDAVIAKLEASGGILRNTDGKIAVLRPRKTPATPSEKPEILSIKDLENALNAMYKPLGLAVKYDEGMKLFELSIININQPGPTTYEFAVDPQMEEGGAIFKGGKLYLASDFNPNNLFTLRRSDYEYPFPNNGMNYHTLITISDNPLQNPSTVYKGSRTILRKYGTESWEQVPGAGSQGPENLFTRTSREYNSGRYRLDEAKYAETVRPKGVDAAKEEQYFNKEGSIYKTVTKEITAEQKEAIRNDKIVAFVDDPKVLGKDGFSGKFAAEFRKLSNAETKSRNLEKLTARVQELWKEVNPNENPLSEAELQVTMNVLVNKSFHELDDNHFVKECKNKDPNSAEYKEARKKAFKERLEFTRTALTRQFQSLLELNQKNHPVGSLERIRNTSAKIADFAIKRVSGIDPNMPDDQQIHISQVDRFMALAATMNIEGLRGSSYTGFAKDPLYTLLASKEPLDRSKLEKEPDSLEADLIRIAFEGLSPIPEVVENGVIKPAEAKKFMNSELALTLFSGFENANSALMFSKPEYRYEIAKLMEVARKEAKDNKEMEELLKDPKSPASLALLEFHTIVRRIRDAELKGQKEIKSPYNEKFIFDIELDLQDGVYRRCTNYTMWVKERIGYRVPKAPGNYPGFAAYGSSTATVQETGFTQESTKYMFGVGVAVKGPETGGGGGGATAQEPEAGPGGKTGGGAGKPGGRVEIRQPRTGNTGQEAKAGEQ